MQYTLYAMGRHREVITATKPILDLDARSVFAYQNLGFAYAFLGRADSAVAALEKAIVLDPQVFGGRVFSMFGYAAAGRWSDAERERGILEREQRNSPNFVKAFVAVTFGQLDSAAVAVERGIAGREPLFKTMFVSCDPAFDPIKSHPRFQAAMRRLNARVCPPQGTWPIPSRRPTG
jgi:tetratricopeptide (TPR) repeat protein